MLFLLLSLTYLGLFAQGYHYELREALISDNWLGRCLLLSLYIFAKTDDHWHGYFL